MRFYVIYHFKLHALIEEHIWDLEKKLLLFKVIVNINNKILWVEMFESLTTMPRR